MPSDPEQLLLRLAAGDERVLETVMAPTREYGTAGALSGQALDRRTRMLVRLAALLAVGAPTTSVNWAAELAFAAGASVEVLIGVLLASAPAAGTVRVVQGAPRLAVALGFDLELEGWDGS